MTSIRSELRLLGSLKARKIVQPGLLASACGEVAFFASAWAIGSILLWHEKWNQVPTDPDYALTAGLGMWTVFVRAIIWGAFIGLVTLVPTARYFYRRTAHGSRKLSPRN